MQEKAMTWRQYEVEAATSGQRLDQALTHYAEDLSRTRIQALIQAGAVQLNNQPCTLPKTRVRHGDWVQITLPPAEPTRLEAEPIPLDIVYEDDALLVVNKPAGLVVHPAPGHSGGTLVNGLLHYCGAAFTGIGGVERPGIVHRLDKDTSGLLVVAKTEAALTALAAQFAQHQVARRYRALVWGLPKPLTGRIDAPIGRHRSQRQRMAVVRQGKEAVTHYQVVQPFLEGAVTEVSCKLETGRTHQIRAHLSHSGHAVLADPLYGTQRGARISALPETARAALAAMPGQALHAEQLGFTHPDGDRWLDWEAPPPQAYLDLRGALAAARSEEPQREPRKERR